MFWTEQVFMLLPSKSLGPCPNFHFVFVLLKINTDGLVLRGWYTCLTLAVYGTAELTHSHERGSPPPPPPPLPQQQPLGSKKIIKPGQHKHYIHRYIMLCHYVKH